MGKEWIRKQKKDKYYKKAKKEEMRSRAAFKLRQIQEKFAIFNDETSLILDLCCAPGSWIEEIKRHFTDVTVIGVDLVNMSPIEGVRFVQGDIREDIIIERLGVSHFGKVDVILSDCAPKFTGSKETDYARQTFLVERVLMIKSRFLKEGGHLVCKLFDGDHTTKFREELKSEFEKIHLFKPEASRKKSGELFLIGKHYNKTK